MGPFTNCSGSIIFQFFFWAVFTTKQAFEGQPILFVYHNENGDWQFQTSELPDIQDSMVVALENITKLDPTINEIYHLQKKNDIEIRAFDTEVTDVVKYKGNNQFPRSRCGGTSFTAAVNYYNNSMYNSCIVFTDGHAETPPPTIKNLLWVISSNGSSEAIKNHSKWIKI